MWVEVRTIEGSVQRMEQVGADIRLSGGAIVWADL